MSDAEKITELEGQLENTQSELEKVREELRQAQAQAEALARERAEAENRARVEGDNRARVELENRSRSDGGATGQGTSQNQGDALIGIPPPPPLIRTPGRAAFVPSHF